MLLSYFVGQKKYPIDYDLKSIGGYVACAGVLCLVGLNLPIENTVVRLAVRTLLLALYVAYIVRHDLPLRSIPVVNRFVKG
jgi:hypothetical protein